MLRRLCLLSLAACPAALLIASLPLYASDAEATLQGHVIDEAGHPAAGIEVGFYWSANEWFDEKGERKPMLDVWRKVGGMRALVPVKTDADGRFTLKADDADRHRGVLAMDAERRRGGTARADEDGRLTIRLEPLTRVQGRFRRAESGKVPEWSAVYVLTPDDDRFPLTRNRLAHCGSYDGRFEFLLPPGTYLLEGYGSEEEDSLNLKAEAARKIEITADGGEIDVGKWHLLPWDKDAEIAKADAPAGDYRQRYGQPAPRWYAADGRDIAANAEVSDFEGRWVVLYFWGTGCLPCLREGIPKLMAFNERHQDAADRFAVVTIFEGLEADGFATLKDLNRWLAPIERRVWKRELNLPILLDTTYRTRKSFGLQYYGTALLIDPAGKLVRVEPAENGEMLGPVLERLTKELDRANSDAAIRSK